MSIAPKKTTHRPTQKKNPKNPPFPKSKPWNPKNHQIAPVKAPNLSNFHRINRNRPQNSTFNRSPSKNSKSPNPAPNSAGKTTPYAEFRRRNPKPGRLGAWPASKSDLSQRKSSKKLRREDGGWGGGECNLYTQQSAALGNWRSGFDQCELDGFGPFDLVVQSLKSMWRVESGFKIETFIEMPRVK